MTRTPQSNFFPRQCTPYVSSGGPHPIMKIEVPRHHPSQFLNRTIAASGAQISTPPLPLQANNDM